MDQCQQREVSHTPWVEKYRPQRLENIILDAYNRRFFDNVLASRQLPHLLFYGPPGAGKTTTILSMIRQFAPEVKHEVLHLNSSDLRGIDVVREQILNFVNSNSFFPNAIKFVVLDEVDNMTKNAQYGLTYLMQTLPMVRVRFCLICNYISKIVPSLKHEFVTIRFNQLPEKYIIEFLAEIADKEKIQISKRAMKRLCVRFGSDVRSMINYMQTQHCTAETTAATAVAAADNDHLSVLNDISMLGSAYICRALETCDTVESFETAVFDMTRKCNCSIKEVLREYFMGFIAAAIEEEQTNDDKFFEKTNICEMMCAMEHVLHNIHTNMDAANVRYAFWNTRRHRRSSAAQITLPP